MLAPGLGHDSSTWRILDAPTTHEGYSHPLAKMAKTSSGVQLSCRRLVAMILDSATVLVCLRPPDTVSAHATAPVPLSERRVRRSSSTLLIR